MRRHLSAGEAAPVRSRQALVGRGAATPQPLARSARAPPSATAAHRSALPAGGASTRGCVAPPPPLPLASSSSFDAETTREVRELLERVRLNAQGVVPETSPGAPVSPGAATQAQSCSRQRPGLQLARAAHAPSVSPAAVARFSGGGDSGGDSGDSEERELLAREAMLRSEMDAVGQRQAHLAARKREAVLRSGMEAALAEEGALLAATTGERLRDLEAARVAEEQALHTLKGDLAAKIEELCSLYDMVSARAREVAAARNAEAAALEAALRARIEDMRAAAESALRERLAAGETTSGGAHT